MSISDWLQDSQNWVFVVLALTMLFTAWRVVTTRNVVHAVLYLVVTLAISAGFFLLLGAEFLAWVVVLVSIGAVVVLFLFGIMITRAPLGSETELSHPSRIRLPAAIGSFLLFVFVGGAVLVAFEDAGFDSGVTTTAAVGDSIFNRWVIPFEVVSVLLLAAIVALTGCSPESKPWGLEAPGLTREQVNQRHVEAMQVDSWQLQDDIDAFFLFDRPGRMNRLVVR